MADKLILRDETLRGKALAQIMGLDLSKPWEVTIKPYRRSRSVEQNRYYWKMLQVAADEIGCEAEDLHDVARHKFLPPVFADIKGEVHEVRRSTTKLNVKEMAEYTEKVTAWLQVDLGIVLPEDRYAA